MTYQINILPRTRKVLEKLPREAYEAIKQDMLALASKPRPVGSKKLTGRQGWRIRIGNYRVIYEIDDKSKVITILDINHRKDVYR